MRCSQRVRTKRDGFDSSDWWVSSTPSETRSMTPSLPILSALKSDPRQSTPPIPKQPSSDIFFHSPFSTESTKEKLPGRTVTSNCNSDRRNHGHLPNYQPQRTRKSSLVRSRHQHRSMDRTSDAIPPGRIDLRLLSGSTPVRRPSGHLRVPHHPSRRARHHPWPVIGTETCVYRGPSELSTPTRTPSSR